MKHLVIERNNAIKNSLVLGVALIALLLALAAPEALAHSKWTTFAGHSLPAFLPLLLGVVGVALNSGGGESKSRKRMLGVASGICALFLAIAMIATCTFTLL